MTSNLESHFGGRLMRLASPVNRVEFRSPDQIEALARESLPGILTGATDDWPARRAWNPDYFKERWGGNQLRAHETQWKGSTPYLIKSREKAALKSFSEFIDQARSDASYDLYVHQVEAAAAFPGSDADLAYENLTGTIEAGPLKPNVWMGTPGTRSGLHWDAQDNLIAMFYGAKAFMLVDPRDPALLYPFQINPSKSQIDPANVNWSLFPRFAEARIYIDVLRPGETLFLPRGWWHYLTSLELCINSTCWFRMKGVHEGAFPLVRYVLRCGPSYTAHVIYQFLWYGLLRRHWEPSALSPPPPGLRLWNQFRGRRRAPASNSAANQKRPA